MAQSLFDPLKGGRKKNFYITSNHYAKTLWCIYASK